MSDSRGKGTRADAIIIECISFTIFHQQRFSSQRSKEKGTRADAIIIEYNSFTIFHQQLFSTQRSKDKGTRADPINIECNSLAKTPTFFLYFCPISNFIFQNSKTPNSWRSCLSSLSSSLTLKQLSLVSAINTTQILFHSLFLIIRKLILLTISKHLINITYQFSDFHKYTDYQLKAFNGHP